MMMRFALVAAALLAATACSTAPEFKTDKELACAADFLPWGGGLTFALTQGEGGVFDFDPLGLESRMFGSYDLVSGDFAYKVAYPDRHWRAETEVDGYGYAHTNGDLDIIGTMTTTDVLDEEWEVDFRYERFGCNVTHQMLDEAGNLFVEEGRFIDGAYQYDTQIEAASGGGYEIEGERFADLTYVETIEIEDGTYLYESETEGDGEGGTETDWTQSDNGYEAEGTTEVGMDGDTREVYDYVSSSATYTWDVEYDYEGDGEGTIEWEDGSVCDVVYEDYACEYDCGDGWQDC